MVGDREGRPPPRRVPRRRRRGAAARADRPARRARPLAPRRAVPQRVAPQPGAAVRPRAAARARAPPRRAGDVPADARLRLDYERAPGVAAAELGLGEFLELNARVPGRRSSARAARRADFARGRRGDASAADGAELGKRADRAVAALRRRATRSRSAARRRAPRSTRCATRLVDLVFLGFAEAVPLSARGDDGPARRARRRDAARGDPPARPVPSSRRLRRAAGAPDERVAHERRGSRRSSAAASGRCRSCARRTPPSSGRRSRRSDALLGGDPLQALSWLQGVEPRPAGRVAPAGARSTYAARARAHAGARAAGRAAAVRRRASAGSALPSGGAELRPGKLSLVAHLPRPFRADAPLAGLRVDEWVEAVPVGRGDDRGRRSTTTRPGARPPQAVLLAVAPPGAERWERRDAREDAARDARARAAARRSTRRRSATTRCCSARCRRSTSALNLAGETLSTDFSRAVRD